MEPIQRTPLATVLLLTTCVLFGACGSEGDDDDMADVPCSEDARSQVFAEDMQAAGVSGLATFTLHSITPNPPDIGDNNWELSAQRTGDGSALTGCTLDVRPWMPDHNHGSNNPAGSEGAAGTYSVEGISFIMPGYWENTVTINCGGDGDDDDSASDGSEEPPTEALSDSGIFGFCIEG